MNNDIFFAPGITIRSLVLGRPKANEEREVASEEEAPRSVREPKEAR